MSLEAIFQEIEAEHKKLPGKTSFYYKNLVSGKTFGLNASVPIIAASVNFSFKLQKDRSI